MRSGAHNLSIRKTCSSPRTRAAALLSPRDADVLPTPHFAPPPLASPTVTFTAFIPHQNPATFDQKAYISLVGAQALAAGAVGAIATVLSVSEVGRRRLASLGINVATLVTLPSGQDAAAAALTASVHSSDLWLQSVYGGDARTTSAPQSMAPITFGVPPPNDSSQSGSPGQPPSSPSPGPAQNTTCRRVARVGMS